MYRERAESDCEMSAMVPNCVTDSPRWFCDSLWKVSDYRDGIMTPFLILLVFRLMHHTVSMKTPLTKSMSSNFNMLSHNYVVLSRLNYIIKTS